MISLTSKYCTVLFSYPQQTTTGQRSFRTQMAFQNRGAACRLETYEHTPTLLRFIDRVPKLNICTFIALKSPMSITTTTENRLRYTSAPNAIICCTQKQMRSGAWWCLLVVYVTTTSLATISVCIGMTCWRWRSTFCSINLFLSFWFATLSAQVPWLSLLTI